MECIIYFLIYTHTHTHTIYVMSTEKRPIDKKKGDGDGDGEQSCREKRGNRKNVKKVNQSF